MEDCIFCKIAAGEIPAEIVYEDDDIVAFKDLSPQAKIHVLVIPRKHYKDLNDGVDEKTLGHLFAKIPQIASLLGIKESGYRVIVNTGKDAGQTIFHLHVHILGGTAMSEQMVVT